MRPFDYETIREAALLLNDIAYIPCDRLAKGLSRYHLDCAKLQDLKRFADMHANGRLDRADLFAVLARLDEARQQGQALGWTDEAAIIAALRMALGFSAEDKPDDVQTHFKVTRFSDPEDPERAGQVAITVFTPPASDDKAARRRLHEDYIRRLEPEIRAWLASKPELNSIRSAVDPHVPDLAARVADLVEAYAASLDTDKGDPLVIFPGILHTSATVKYVAQLLALRDRRFVSVIDLPSMGGTKLDGNQAVLGDDLVNAAVAGLRAAVDTEKPFRVMGHSLGTLPARMLHVKKEELGLQNLAYTYLLAPVPGRLDRLMGIRMTPFMYATLEGIIMHLGDGAWSKDIETGILTYFFFEQHEGDDLQEMTHLVKREAFHANLYSPTTILRIADDYPIYDLLRAETLKSEKSLDVQMIAGDKLFEPLHPFAWYNIAGISMLDPSNTHDCVAGKRDDCMEAIARSLQNPMVWGPQRKPISLYDFRHWRQENTIGLAIGTDGRQLDLGLQGTLGRAYGPRPLGPSWGMSTLFTGGVRAGTGKTGLHGSMGFEFDHFYRDVDAFVGLTGFAGMTEAGIDTTLRPSAWLRYRYAQILCGQVSLEGPSFSEGNRPVPPWKLGLQIGFFFD